MTVRTRKKQPEAWGEFRLFRGESELEFVILIGKKPLESFNLAWGEREREMEYHVNGGI